MAFQKFKILQNIFFDKILSDPFTLQFTAGIKLLNSELLKNSMTSRQIQAISFLLVAMINQLIYFVEMWIRGSTDPLLGKVDPDLNFFSDFFFLNI